MDVYLSPFLSVAPLQGGAKEQYLSKSCAHLKLFCKEIATQAWCQNMLRVGRVRAAEKSGAACAFDAATGMYSFPSFTGEIRKRQQERGIDRDSTALAKVMRSWKSLGLDCIDDVVRKEINVCVNQLLKV